MTKSGSEKPRKPSTTTDNAETQVSGLFVLAFIAGLVATLDVFFICFGLHSNLIDAFFDWDFLVPLVFGVQFSVPFFVGGFVSGWIMYLKVRRSSWGFLYLAAASPAMPVFCIAVLAALLAVEPSVLGLGTEAFGIVLLMCISALAGSLLGHWIGYRSRVRRGGTNSPSQSSRDIAN